MWSRPHSAQATAPDPVPQPTNFQLVISNPFFSPVLYTYWCFTFFLLSIKMLFGPSYWLPPLLAWPWQPRLRRHRHFKFPPVSQNFYSPFLQEVPWKESLNAMDKLLLNWIQRTLRSRVVRQVTTLIFSSRAPLQTEFFISKTWPGVLNVTELYLYCILPFTMYFYSSFGLGCKLYIILFKCTTMTVHEWQVRNGKKESEDRYNILYSVLCILYNAFCNPRHITNLLFLQLHIGIKHAILELLKERLLV